MSDVILKNPACLFEVSWEVCNKVGGIHTVISTKALSMSSIFNNNHILIGPDIWRSNDPNPEFTEDPQLLKSWRIKVAQDNMRIKVGRWNIAGNPIVILVDFSQYVQEKNNILSIFWEKFKLDSIHGQWDYIEPLLFGYAAGRVIEHFVRYNVSARQHVVAQFHEWMTGSGLLYLKSAIPQVACVFTTHATVLGRSIAGNNLPLYNSMSKYDPTEAAMHFHVEAKQSLESKAAKYADCFTTVSEITALECAHFLGKQVDIVTPNGFENSLTPSDAEYEGKRKAGRDKLLSVAQALISKPISKDALLVGISGRYEFKNKGIDLFIDALGDLNREDGNSKEVIAFILVPGGYRNVNMGVLNNLNNPDKIVTPKVPYVTHELSDPNSDPILRKIGEKQLFNNSKDRVKVIFCPCYLNGDDGLFNMHYYDLLIGMDLTVFPSYYEPWGYTPLESLAFKVPTITTSLAGFGSWVKAHYSESHLGIGVINRDDHNNEEVVNSIKERIDAFQALSPEAISIHKQKAWEVSQIALWENLINYYMSAYEMAIKKVDKFIDENPLSDSEQLKYIEKQFTTQNPNWISVIVHRSIPESLMALEKLAYNLWWSWNEDAIDLFKSMDPVKWHTLKNPIALLDKISLNRYRELENDQEFVDRLNSIYKEFTYYMEGKKHMSDSRVAYFSMEYGLHSCLKIYSGGLGVLAGDYLKEASDKQSNITGIGLLYHYGYFDQKFSATGDQEAEYVPQDFTKIPVQPVRDKDGNWVIVTLPFPGRIVSARIWRVDVGRVELYLLDTDFEDNREEDCKITHDLYGGDIENRLKQEILLGIGGVQVLRKLGIDVDIYHCNEGHAAFINVERLSELVEKERLGFAEALEVVRSSSLFTTHTPVPAGHDTFSEIMLRSYISHYAERLNITWEQLIALGRANVNDHHEKFSMSYFAAKTSQEINGVSWLHGQVSREIFKELWPGYMPEELHISHVTNGVHYGSWTAPEWKEIHSKVFGEQFSTHHYDLACFENIYKVSDSTITGVRNILRKRLIKHIRERLSDVGDTAYFTPRELVQINETLRDNILTIGFARRFATYKRAHLLFNDLDRLNGIINNPDRPVQFVFAGKAHPADKAGQDIIKRIVEISKYPEFLGKIIFLPNYDMDLARRMVQGVDVWMNTPTRPQEASGTSGQKAAMNGVMHFSVLDGWWVEGYQPETGWSLPMERTYENQEFQNELDSELIYNIIEDQIAPMFYAIDSNSAEGKESYSSEWVRHIKNTIAKVASNFTTNRMLNDYEQLFYIPMTKRHRELVANHYGEAIEISEWKKEVAREWDSVEVKSVTSPDNAKNIISLGETYSIRAEVELGELSTNDIGVELVVTEQVDGKIKVKSTHDFVPTSVVDRVALYDLDITTSESGIYTLGLRIYPKNPLLAHRQDFGIVKWF